MVQYIDCEKCNLNGMTHHPCYCDERPEPEPEPEQPKEKIPPRKSRAVQLDELSDEERWVSTSEFCKHAHVQNNTVHVHSARHGHYYGVVPQKQPNGRLLWPLHDWYALIKRLAEQTGTEDVATET